ncbi:pantoate-beta-alanine ligase [Cavenderia fasciculata]|uniref:Pantoate--beta-alanine ligase n=1 Tax=Cavenderia fasciculata TaxID=261658 RepID=F4QER0_CACFS|nr:pantoate-beta-alanine ligase [Cavenderia fasciculata]EGG13321.1 pantoate-beta-alanine ligase [Cavenderia fasciculata]|eukprot:XP_004350020.1 pantoate-beta-alanine ligase [Cavenderia fasciculata]
MVIKICETIQSIRDEIKNRKRKDIDALVTFVPTMGYLHRGHITLVDVAKRDGQIVVVSIFVNPTQFGPTEDLAAYPRDIENDVRLLNEACPNAILFLPSSKEMYPSGVVNLSDATTATYVDVGSMTTVREGIARPGHFRGVATVVTKLVNIVQPDIMYLGQKDAMQCVCLKKCFQDLNNPTRVVIVDTVREPSGLAMSSRNSYLTESERLDASLIYRSMKEVASVYRTLSVEQLQEQLTTKITSNPKMVVEYISVANGSTGSELSPSLDSIPPQSIISLAVFFNGQNRKTRLIDVLIL